MKKTRRNVEESKGVCTMLKQEENVKAALALFCSREEIKRAEENANKLYTVLSALTSFEINDSDDEKISTILCEVLKKLLDAINDFQTLQKECNKSSAITNVMLLIIGFSSRCSSSALVELQNNLGLLIRHIIKYKQLDKSIPFILAKYDKFTKFELLPFSQFKKQTESVDVVNFFRNIRTLTHATSVANFIKMLQQARNSNCITIKANKNNWGDFVCEQGLVHCAFDVSSDIWSTIENSTCYKQAKELSEEQRYGNVLLKFPSELISQYKVYELGTKFFFHEHAQVLLATKHINQNFFLYNPKDDDVTQLTEILFDHQTYQTELKYSQDGSWTHPEVAFVEDISIPFKELSVEFVNQNRIIKLGCHDLDSKSTAILKFAESFKTTFPASNRDVLNKIGKFKDLDQIKKHLNPTEISPPEKKKPKLDCIKS